MAETGGIVAHVFLRGEEGILLLRRSGTGFQDGNYGPPGGHLGRVGAAGGRRTHRGQGICHRRSQ